MRRFLIIFTLICSATLHFSASASCERSLSREYVELMNHDMLIRQKDYRLARRNLLSLQGGLCGPTCAVNVLHAISSFLGRASSKFPAINLIERMVELAKNHHQVDARDGVYFSTLASVLSTLAEELELAIEAKHMESASLGLKFEDLKPATDELLILGIENGFSHAIVAMDMDLVRSELVYSDPYNPNKLLRAKMYHSVDVDNHPVIKIDFKPGLDGTESHLVMVQEVLRIKLVPPQ